MADIAITYPGKFGDCLWSLATTREIAKTRGPVDFYIMPQLRDLLSLLQYQSYIENAYVLENWYLTGEVPGYQPWQNPPLPLSYSEVIPLGYRSWPNTSLIDFIAGQVNITLNNPIPFIETDYEENYDIAIGFSSIYDIHKVDFLPLYLDKIRQVKPDVTYIDVNYGGWLDISRKIKGCKVFIGNKSSLHVLAHGLGKYVIEAESDGNRRNPIFCNPYGQYFMPNFDNIFDGIDQYVTKTLELL